MSKTQSQRQKEYHARLFLKLQCRRCLEALDRDGVYCRQCCDKQKEKQAALKIEVLSHYGSVCVCCKEAAPVFLCFDHKDGKGAEHRNSLYPNRPYNKGNGASGYRILEWIKKNKYPDMFQILCWNCNYAKHALGVCPHQSERTQ